MQDFVRTDMDIRAAEILLSLKYQVNVHSGYYDPSQSINEYNLARKRQPATAETQDKQVYATNDLPTMQRSREPVSDDRAASSEREGTETRHGRERASTEEIDALLGPEFRELKARRDARQRQLDIENSQSATPRKNKFILKNYPPSGVERSHSVRPTTEADSSAHHQRPSPSTSSIASSPPDINNRLSSTSLGASMSHVQATPGTNLNFSRTPDRPKNAKGRTPLRVTIKDLKERDAKRAASASASARSPSVRLESKSKSASRKRTQPPQDRDGTAAPNDDMVEVPRQRSAKRAKHTPTSHVDRGEFDAYVGLYSWMKYEELEGSTEAVRAAVARLGVLEQKRLAKAQREALKQAGSAEARLETSKSETERQKATRKEHESFLNIVRGGFVNPNGPCKQCQTKGEPCFITKERGYGKMMRCSECVVSKGAIRGCNIGTPEERGANKTKKAGAYGRKLEPKEDVREQAATAEASDEEEDEEDTLLACNSAQLMSPKDNDNEQEKTSTECPNTKAKSPAVEAET